MSSRLLIPTRNYMHSEPTHIQHILPHTYTCKVFATDYISLNIAQGAMVHSIIKAGRCVIIFLSKTNTENNFIIMPLKYQHCIFSMILQKYTRLLVHWYEILCWLSQQNKYWFLCSFILWDNIFTSEIRFSA